MLHGAIIVNIHLTQFLYKNNSNRVWEKYKFISSPTIVEIKNNINSS
jgi:hypothetical protein